MTSGFASSLSARATRIFPSPDVAPDGVRGRALMLAHGARPCAGCGPVSALRVSIADAPFAALPRRFAKGSALARSKTPSAQNAIFPREGAQENRVSVPREGSFPLATPRSPRGRGSAKG